MEQRTYTRLLQIEPRLGAGLSARERAEATRLVVAPVATLPAGRWNVGELRSTLGRCAFGCMIADGLIAHDLELAGRTATYLLGRGDILAPAPAPLGTLPANRLFTVADPVRLAILDEAFVAVARRFPSIAGALLVRATQQSEHVAVHQLISQVPRADQRILAVLWHLADRWGHAEPGGIVVPLAMGHEAIGRLVGGARPTVSTALGRLAKDGLVQRLANGTWLLAPDSHRLLDGSHAPAPPQDICLLGPRDCEEEAPDPVEPAELRDALVG